MGPRLKPARNAGKRCEIAPRYLPTREQDCVALEKGRCGETGASGEGESEPDVEDRAPYARTSRRKPVGTGSEHKYKPNPVQDEGK